MKTKVSIFGALIVFCLIGLVSCNYQNEGDSAVWTKVDFSIDRDSRSTSGPRMATSGAATSLIIVVSASVTSVSLTAYISDENYDQQILNPDNTVILTVPVGEPFRLIKLNFSSELTLPQILSQLPEPVYSGISAPITITAEETERTVAIAMSAAGSGVTGFMGEGIQGIVLNLTGIVTTFAGSGTTGTTDGATLSAEFYAPHDIATDGTYIFVADKFNNLIRMIDIAKQDVTTLAGGGDGGTPCVGSNNTNCKDGTGNAAQFNQPAGITIHNGFLYVADQMNHRIRKVSYPGGVVTTFAGEGSQDFADHASDPLSAMFNGPTGMTTDGINLYIADMYNGLVRKIVIATGAVTTLAGTGSEFYDPHDLTTDGTNLYVANLGRHVINKIVLNSGTVSVLVGTLDTGGYQDSTDGTANGVLLQEPEGITMDGTYIYFTDHGTDPGGSYELSLLRRVHISTGNTTTIAGSGSGGGGSICSGDNNMYCYNGTGLDAQFYWAHDLCTDGSYLYLADFNNDRIRRIE